MRHFLQIILPIFLFFSLGVLYAQDSLNVSLVAQVHHDWSYARNVVINGDFAFVATDETGLRIVDVSNPDNPEEISHIIRNYALAQAVAVQDSFVFVMYSIEDELRLSGLSIVDASDPYSPEETGFYSTTGHTLYDLAVQVNLAYLVDGRDLDIVDISDPENPTRVGVYDSPQEYGLVGVVISDSIACLACNHEGLRLVDISDPTDPEEVAHLETPGDAINISVNGNYVYLACDEAGLRIIDISEVSDPVEVSSFNPEGYVRQIYISGEYAFVGTGISEMVGPEEYERQVFYILNISDPLDPVESGIIDMRDHTWSVNTIAVTGDIAHVTAGYSGLREIDISDVLNPTEIGFFDSPRDAGRLCISEGFAYVIENRGNILWIIDIDLPTNPVIAGYYYFNLPTLDTRYITISGDYVYISAEENGIRIINVSDPSDPFEAGVYNPMEWAWGATISGDYIYIASLNEGLHIADISNPVSPREVAIYDNQRSATNVKVANGFAYVVGYGLENGGLSIIDISDPTEPDEVGFYNVEPDGAKEVSISGDYAYVMNWDGVIQKINISDSDSLTSLWSFDRNHRSENLTVNNGMAYIADGLHGFSILDITEQEPIQVGYYYGYDYTYDVAFVDGYAYMANSRQGFQIFDCRLAINNVNGSSNYNNNIEFSVSSTFPNPFNCNTLIHFSIPINGKVAFSITNILGQYIFNKSANYMAGDHNILLDVNRFTKYPSSGIYLLNVQYNEQSRAQRLYYIK
ncbi:MAG: T9SS type A sorting domain-containing protein [Candidatus Electryonea clarkiae]|nr:T9SS type A sorting domain-containing protein [Candidatus Electryonea clarkiae]MDP8286586.1 T9SS type A sorting domain-containing protein [Candidatus Electryonea clarkiae]